jgi:two-component system response regulator
MDLYMPGMNGHEATRVIKSDPLNRDVPVYIFSTSESPKDKKASLDCGARDHVVKALDYKDVMNQLTSILKTLQ